MFNEKEIKDQAEAAALRRGALRPGKGDPEASPGGATAPGKDEKNQTPSGGGFWKRKREKWKKKKGKGKGKGKTPQQESGPEAEARRVEVR